MLIEAAAAGDSPPPSPIADAFSAAAEDLEQVVGILSAVRESLDEALDKWERR